MRIPSCEQRDNPDFGETKCDLHPKLWRPQTWGLTHLLFVHERTHVVQSGVSPATILETLDVLKGTASGLCSRLKGLTLNAFALETMEETFHRGIVVAIGSPAHADDHAFLL